MSAVKANSILKGTDDALTKSMERLSSGLKVNHAKDNPAGIAIAKRMNAQIKGLSIAGDNAGDGISIIETADGALSEIHAILQRMNELAMEASNGTKTDEDRECIDQEIKQLKNEIDRIGKSTDFNGQNLLDGGFDYRGYSSDSNVKVAYYSDEVELKSYDIQNVVTSTDSNGNLKVDSLDLLLDGSANSFPANTSIKEINGTMVTITGDNGFEMMLDIKGSTGSATLEMTGIGAMRMQIGANEGQVLEMRIPETSLRMMGLKDITVATTDDAVKALDRIGEAINYVSSVRSRLGAYQNRLESTSESLDVTEENMTTSYSRIMDLDMAEEMTNYTTQQVLIQAGTSVLAQANERPQQVLQLLQ